jgi:putative endonuclease
VRPPAASWFATTQRHPRGRIGTLISAAAGLYAAVVNARQQFGRAAEAAAAAYLVRDGWTLLGRNVRIGRGELDLIARRRGVLAFVEVKARRSAACGSPEDAVDGRKRRQVARLAELWLAARPWALRGVTDVRFDVVAVDATVRPLEVRHLPGAFTLDG